jgi:hypothetical protein
MKIWLFYNVLIVLAITTFTAFRAESLAHLILPLLLTPALYYLYQDFKKTNKRISKNLPTQTFAAPLVTPSLTTMDQPLEGEVLPSSVSDTDRRLFLKLIGSTGLTLTLMAIFTKDAKAAFFGSVPGPGTVAVKDSTGATIDPAEKQPTDGYEISQIDDSSTPAYYGFVHKTGAWYITREDSSGNYRYSKGLSSFSTNWTGRVGLTYDYFDAVF